MKIAAAADWLYRKTELDVIRPSSIVSEKAAAKWTTRNNLGNAVMYGLNAAFGAPSVVINGLAAVVKVGYGLVLAMSALGEKGASQDARMSLAADLMKSGGENLLVGLIACLPGYGQALAGAGAFRSVADACNADNAVRLLPPKS